LNSYSHTAGRVSAAAIILVLLGGCGGSSHRSTMAPAGATRPRPPTFGHGAVASEASRTVEVTMSDDLRFQPAQLNIKRGEIVIFHLVNGGKLVHEFTLGGPDSQELHEDQMAEMDMGGGTGASMDMGSMGNMGSGHTGRMPGMKMDRSHKKYLSALRKRIAELDGIASASDSVHIPPGESRDLVWAFSGERAPEFACHIPGHWHSGMKGSISFS
jgi:uncharacterized cupredoxin-like copper-binding protein